MRSMANLPVEVCAFCKDGDEAGSLRNTSDVKILAHYNCLLFSSGVTTKLQHSSQDNAAEFDITKVKKEIKRGKKMKCSFCNKRGATVGCDIKACWRTYHYKCVTKHKGIRIRDEHREVYSAYCSEHFDKDQDANDAQLNNGTETSGTSITPTSSNKSCKNKKPKKRKEKMEHSTARKTLKFDGKHNSGHNEPPLSVPVQAEQTKQDCVTPIATASSQGPGGIVQNAERPSDSDGEQEPSHQLLHIHTPEEDMVPGPSTTHLESEDCYIKHKSGSDVDSSESNGSHSAQIKIEQNAEMIAESERMQMPSNHMHHDHLEIPGSSTSLLQQGQPISSSSTVSSGSLTPQILYFFSLNDLVSEQSPENSTISQQAQKDLSNVDGNLGHSGQTVDGPGSSGDLPEDGPMKVEEITYAVEDNVPLSGQTVDEPGSSGDFQEDGPMLVGKITHAVEDTVPLSEKTLQTKWKLLCDPVCRDLNAEEKTASSGAPATHKLNIYSVQLAMQSCTRETTSNCCTDEREQELEQVDECSIGPSTATTMSRLVMSPPGTPGESMDVSLPQAAEKLPSGSSPSYQDCGHDRGCRSFLNPSNPRAIFCLNLYHILEDIDGDLEKQCMDAISSIAIQYRTAKRSGMTPPT